MRKQKGVKIFVPVMHSNKQIKQSIHEGQENGKFNIGEPVMEREITKLAINTHEEARRKKNAIWKQEKFPSKTLEKKP